MRLGVLREQLRQEHLARRGKATPGAAAKLKEAVIA